MARDSRSNGKLLGHHSTQLALLLSDHRVAICKPSLAAYLDIGVVILRNQKVNSSLNMIASWLCVLPIPVCVRYQYIWLLHLKYQSTWVGFLYCLSPACFTALNTDASHILCIEQSDPALSARRSSSSSRYRTSPSNSEWTSYPTANGSFTSSLLQPTVARYRT